MYFGPVGQYAYVFLTMMGLPGNGGRKARAPVISALGAGGEGIRTKTKRTPENNSDRWSGNGFRKEVEI